MIEKLEYGKSYSVYLNSLYGGYKSNVRIIGKTNIDNVVTRIKPKGFDGITIDGFVDSEYINKYPRIKTFSKFYIK